MSYPIKTLSQLPLVLKGFRKEKGLTQAAMAERLGITQQSYAYFEANPATATLERLFMVLRMLDVEISLDHTSPATRKGATPSVKATGKRPSTVKAAGQKISKTPSTVATGKAKPSAVVKANRIAAPTRKKESW
ncbi:MAG: helix-turn-helix domain-containing protein [Sulfuricellaceae bacterium]|nr:helix-turn-helix domain-containing protein [Sulfuricellaceae bacterium]